MRVSALRTGRRKIPGRGTTRMRAAGRATARIGRGGRRAVPGAQVARKQPLGYAGVGLSPSPRPGTRHPGASAADRGLPPGRRPRRRAGRGPGRGSRGRGKPRRARSRPGGPTRAGAGSRSWGAAPRGRARAAAEPAGGRVRHERNEANRRQGRRRPDPSESGIWRAWSEGTGRVSGGCAPGTAWGLAGGTPASTVAAPWGPESRPGAAGVGDRRATPPGSSPRRQAPAPGRPMTSRTWPRSRCVAIALTALR